LMDGYKQTAQGAAVASLLKHPRGARCKWTEISARRPLVTFRKECRNRVWTKLHWKLLHRCEHGEVFFISFVYLPLRKERDHLGECYNALSFNNDISFEDNNQPKLIRK